MEISKYEDLKVTTMTLVASLNGTINKDLAYLLLPVTRIELNNKKEANKIKLPHIKIPGSILSIQYKGEVRGIIKNKGSPFKNNVTIDMSIEHKNINLKLSENSIQMCGARSINDGYEACGFILKHLKHIQYLLDKINNEPKIAHTTTEWVKSISKGHKVEIENYNIIQTTKCNLKIYAPIIEYTIIKPQSIPDYIDKELATFYLSMANDFIYYGAYCRCLEFINTMTKVIDDDIAIQSMEQAMVNYNYSLKYKIDRYKLNKLINHKNGFISRYDNATYTSVTIELPYIPPQGNVMKRKKNKIPHHTWLVYRSGSVTQSGPGGELMREAYYMFMKTIAEILPDIIYYDDENPISNSDEYNSPSSSPTSQYEIDNFQYLFTS